MKIYISGKMRGLPEEESRKIFKAAEQYLKELGHDVINPWDNEHKKNEKCKDWSDYILFDLPILKTCDAIFMLDNWRDCWGAKCEHAFASGNGMEIIYETGEPTQKSKDDFNKGLWCAVQDLVAVYAEPTLAADIVRSSGMSVDDMMKAQEESGCYEEQMLAFIEQFEQ